MAAGHRRWTAISQQVKAERRPCWLAAHGMCTFNGEPIDYQASWPDRRSFSADHITPTNHGGLDTYENCGATHLSCNNARHDDPVIKYANVRTDNY